MRVFVITGNIASGKSTVSNLVHQVFPDCFYLCMDRIRVRLYRSGLHGFELERQAERELITAISSDKAYIYESTGNTLFYKRVVREGFSDHDIVSIHVTCDPEECNRRFNIRKRDHFQVQPPYKKLTVKQSIQKNHQAYRTMNFDHVIDNNGSVKDLVRQVRDLPLPPSEGRGNHTLIYG